MSYENNQFKELVNEAIHNHFHDKTETEMILKDWLYGICEQLDKYENNKYRTHVNDRKAEAFDAILKAYDEAFSREHMAGEVSNIIEKYESESNRYYDKIDELDRVYAQAAKADEYEAKAKAFDHIENLVKTELTSDDLYNDARNNDYVAGMLRVYETVDYIIEEYESGEYEIK